MSTEFHSWLQGRLDGLECDIGVIVPYITSILEDEEGEEDLLESLDSILSSMIDSDAPKGSEILAKWTQLHKEHKNTPPKESLDLTAALSEIVESKSSAYRDSIKKGPSNTDAAVKAAILAGYSQQEDEQEEDEGVEDDVELMARNTNAEAVAKADSEKREKARASASAKKEKDKEDRENQKKSQEERKKKAQEKTAKGERRR